MTAARATKLVTWFWFVSADDGVCASMLDLCEAPHMTTLLLRRLADSRVPSYGEGKLRGGAAKAS